MNQRTARFSSVVALGVALGWFAVAGEVAAQKAPSQAAAQALFEEGRRLMNQNKFSEACPKLAESQRLDPGAGTLLNLAACYEKNGQTASAWATYKEAVSESEKSNRKEWATKARQKATALEPLLSKMIIAVPAPSRVAGLVVKRDGAEVAAAEWSLPIPVDPGGHTIEVSAPGRKLWTTTAQAGARNDTVTVNVPQLEMAPQEPAAIPTPGPTSPSPGPQPLPPPRDPPRNASPQRTIGFVVSGVGVAGLAVGAIFGLQAVAAKKDAEPNCSDTFESCNRQGLDAVDDAKGKATISTIGFAAGAALAVGGAVLILTAPKGETLSSKAPAPAIGAPWIRAGGVGSGVGLSFGARL